MFVPRCTSRISHLSRKPRASIKHLLCAENCKEALGWWLGRLKLHFFPVLKFLRANNFLQEVRRPLETLGRNESQASSPLEDHPAPV